MRLREISTIVSNACACEDSPVRRATSSTSSHRRTSVDAGKAHLACLAPRTDALSYEVVVSRRTRWDATAEGVGKQTDAVSQMLHTNRSPTSGLSPSAKANLTAAEF